jgi:hypothetical protein
MRKREVRRHRYSTGYVECLEDESSRQFLAVEGLPDVPGVFTPREFDATGESGVGTDALKIGYGEEGEGFYCVDRESGAVLYVESYEGTEYFVNSSLQAFAKCLERFHRETSALATGSESFQCEELAVVLRRGIEDLDPRAVSEDSGFWASLLFDVAIGDYCGDGDSE